MKTTRDDMIQEIEELKAELATLQFDHTSLKAERDDWQTTAMMGREQITALEFGLKDAQDRLVINRLAKEYPGGA